MELILQRLLDGVKLSENEYNKLVTGLCRDGNFARAWRAYRAGKKLGIKLRYNGSQRLVTHAIKAGDLSAAVEAFEDVKKAGMAPNKVTYCSLISALGKDRRKGLRSAQLAYEMWRELKAAGGEALDAAAYRIGMNACVGVGRLPEAEALLKSVAAAGEAQDVRAYNILLKHYSRAADAAVRLPRLLSRMEAAGVQPSPVTYNILVDGYVRTGAMHEARKAMQRAKQAGVRLDAWSYSSLVKGYTNAGDLAGAEAVLHDMRAAGVGPNAVTYSTLLDGYVRAGDLRAALRTLDAMSAAGEAPTVVTYNTLLRGYAAAIGASHAGEGGGSEPSVQQEKLAEGSLRLPGAQQQQAQQGPAGGKVTQYGLQQAFELLDGMQRRGVAPTTDTFNTLMAAAVAGGRPLLAVQLYSRMQGLGLRPDTLTYTTLLKAYSRSDQVQQALSVFEDLCSDANVALDVAAYNAAVHMLCRAGEMRAAERMAEKAAGMAQAKGEPPPLEAYGALVAGYSRLRLVEQAVGAVRRYHAAGGSPDVRMLQSLADVCVRTGEYKVAMQTVRALELLGHPVEKDKYRALVQAEAKRAQRAAQRQRPAGAGGAAASASRRRRPERSSHLERFKFWLGLPNSYYNGSWDEEEAR